ncbi:unnamed protein product, partial [Hapterophycus canaliculatus]
IPPRRRWPRGPTNELHDAVRHGTIRQIEDLLSEGLIDINLGDPRGQTPLMCAAAIGNRAIVGMLLKKGANLSIASDYDFTALHIAAQEGQLDVTEMMAKACDAADLEAVTYEGFTPLHVAVQVKQPAVVRALIEAGANFNSRTPTGQTPLYTAAMRGYLDVVRVLLSAKADPLLPRIDPTGYTCVPLDVAAQSGQPAVIHELIQHFGIQGCGGESGGGDALLYAAQRHNTSILTMLSESGVVDNGVALQAAVQIGNETSVKFLLEHGRNTVASQLAYINAPDGLGFTALFRSITACQPRSPRIIRMLVDAGADTTSKVRVMYTSGWGFFNDTPLALVTRYLREKKVDAKHATEEQLHRLEAIRRMLLRVEAIHGESWLWRSDVFAISRAAGGARRTNQTASVTGRALRPTLPIPCRSSRRSRVLLAALFRWANAMQ